jgi:hypothetical protein
MQILERAESKKQKAKSRKQKAESRKQKAESRKDIPEAKAKKTPSAHVTPPQPRAKG